MEGVAVAGNAEQRPEGRRNLAPCQTVVAHFRDGSSAARAVGELTASGLRVRDVYVIGGAESGLLRRIGVVGDIRRRGGAHPPVVVAAVVEEGDAARSVAVLGGRAEAVGVPERA
jgi:hypothetical protein